MTPGEYLELARLWKEQVDPSEQERLLRSLVVEIERSSRLRKIRDIICSVILFVFLVWGAFKAPATALTLAAEAVALGFVGWAYLTSRRLGKARRSLGGYPANAFLAAAIENVGAELRYSARAMWLSLLVFVALPPIMLARKYGVPVQDVFAGLFSTYLVSLLVVVGGAIAVYAYFFSEHLKLRRQLRRLEAMKQALDDAEGGDAMKDMGS